MPNRYTNRYYHYTEKPLADETGDRSYGPLVRDRYKGTGVITHPIKKPPLPNAFSMRNQKWFKWSPTRFDVVRAALRSVVGSRFYVAGTRQSKAVYVIPPNPVTKTRYGPRGYETMEREAKMGSLKATLNEIAVTRYRRRV
jgi:hypothetical protein